MEAAKKNVGQSTSFLLPIATVVLLILSGFAKSNPTTQIKKGFVATPEQENSEFEALLTDPIGVFAFGFLHVESTRLDLAVIHLPSSFPVWRALPSSPANWARSTSLSFDGNLILTDPTTGKGTVWSTDTAGGDILVLLNSSNLQIKTLSQPNTAVWQSFHHPSDTLVQGQNITSSAPLFTPDQRYALRIESSYLALFMEFNSRKRQLMYWKHTALEGDSRDPIFGQVDPEGFLGLYYVKDRSKADRIPFISFERDAGFHRLTIEKDSNLRGYYWDGKSWELDFEAVYKKCDLPGACGAYGLCIPGRPTCSCLMNGTDGCLQTDYGDLCGIGLTGSTGFSVIRKSGVTVDYTEHLEFASFGSVDQCEKACESNCSCWGTIYNNLTGHCYRLDFPIQTVQAVGPIYEGYFKIRSQTGRVGKDAEKSGSVTLILLLTLIVVVVAGYGGFWFRDFNRREKRQAGSVGLVQELTPVPYRDLRTVQDIETL